MSTVTVILTFQDPAGNPVANGRADINLQQDISTALAGGPQVAAGRTVSVPLDASGVGVASLYPTATMTPSAVYFVTAYTAQGQPVWKGEITVGSGDSYILLEDGSLIWLESGEPDAIFTE